MFNILIIVALSAVLAGQVCTMDIMFINHMDLQFCYQSHADLEFGLATSLQRCIRVRTVYCCIHWVRLGWQVSVVGSIDLVSALRRLYCHHEIQPISVETLGEDRM